MSMTIKIEEIRAVTNKLLTHIEELGVKAVEIEHDYYWTLDPTERYDPAAKSFDPTLGQLSDDWNELTMIRTGQRPPVGAALAWLAAILQATGDQVVG